MAKKEISHPLFLSILAMAKRVIYNIILLSVFIAMVACGGRSKSGGSDKEQSAEKIEVSYAPGERMFFPDFNPSTLRNYDDYRRAIDGYWDDFDFDADTAVVAYNTSSIIQAMSDYVAYIEPQRADSLLRALMHRAERSRPVFDLFIEAADVVLGDPNSPLRNDEYHIPILEVIVESPLLDEYDRIAPMYDLEMARQNRIGSVANNFEYCLANGSKMWMHDIDADYLLIMLNNPGCPMCKEIIEQLTTSPMINELCELGRLKILSLYPDEDIKAWREYLPNMPQSWINAYDEGMKISEQRLYNLEAIPSLYLLDRDKRVLIKDGTQVEYIEYILNMM